MNIKGNFIKGSRHDPYERKYYRKACIYWAHRRIRQQFRLQLKLMTEVKDYDLLNVPVIGLDWFD